MDILHQDDGKNGVFYIEKDGEMLAEMTYVWSANKIIINHTEVSPKLAGKGIGKQLIQKAMEMAREKQIKILPLCPFAKAVFDKVEDYNDVVF